MGGRGAEEVIYGQDNVTTGASSDFSQVYRIVREMVTTYGLGTHRYDYNNMSPSAARQIDLEIEEHVFLEEEKEVAFDHHGKEIKMPYKMSTKLVDSYPRRTLGEK